MSSSCRVSIVPNAEDEEQSVAEIEIMKNLSLGPSCSICEGVCSCAPPKRKAKDSSYPCFWKIQSNPIQKSKFVATKRKRDGILTPSTLKFIVSGTKQKKSEDPAVPQSLLAKDDPSASCCIKPYPFSSETPISCNCSISTDANRVTAKLASLPNVASLSLKDAIISTASNNKTRRVHTFTKRKSQILWKRRIKLSLQDLHCVLPTIPENDERQILQGEDDLRTNAVGGSQSMDGTLSSCSQQALMETINDDITINELASYLDEFVYIPKKMSPMAEMMYT